MINQWIKTFVTYAINTDLWDELDSVYLTNKVMYLIGVDEYEDTLPIEKKSAVDSVNELVNIAIQTKKIEDTAHEKDVLVGQ